MNNEYIIYGCGNFGKKLSHALEKKDHKAYCFIDKNFEGNYNDIQSYKVKDLEKIDNKELPILIAVFNREVDILGLRRTLVEAGFNNVLLPSEYFSYYKEELGWNFWLSSEDIFEKNKSKIDKAKKLFTNSEVFDSVVNYRKGIDSHNLNINKSVQYYPSEIAHLLPKNLSFVDIGAYDGDSINDLEFANCTFEKVFAFEPDINNFKKLSANLRKKNLDAIVFPIGLGDKNSLEFFSNDGSEASSFRQGEKTVPICKLDSVIGNSFVNYIKMDIEGFEKFALSGSKEIIKNQLPALAICIYHNPDDLWEIPILIDEMFHKRYTFYIYTHAESTFDTVLYGIPKKGDENEQ